MSGMNIILKKALFHRKFLSAFLVDNSDPNLVKPNSKSLLWTNLNPTFKVYILTLKKANEKDVDKYFLFSFFSMKESLRIF